MSSVNWGCAVLITAVTVASIDSGQSYVATRADCHVSYRLIIHPQTSTSGIFIALLLCHSLVCCLATTTFIARVKNYITINICLCLVVIIEVPIVTQKQNTNNASYALGAFDDCGAVHSHFLFKMLTT
ncbi:hypothetical protein SCLCIDRAFT_906061 [Scleroderma citrinum Foug A]|uniref:Uncharacterized protein n=1 Tax=Scleroderma citrinum Foug A TaxID=1036808 RepID=A0A0C3E861_9AGAM|nr:hypothetical protein SCLCIDRAFT_906061 [Scleroderma citrinum Foug A]